MVIACNTASAKAARSLRAQFTQIPIAAIEPAYKVVHDENPQGKTLIMATKGTIKSEKFRRLYYSYYNHKTCIHSCPGLADLIEKGGKEELEEYLRKTLAPYRDEVQNVVLGCTHYPLAKEEIKDVLGDVRFLTEHPERQGGLNTCCAAKTYLMTAALRVKWNLLIPPSAKR